MGIGRRTRAARELQALAEETAKRRDVVDEALGKSGLGGSFATGELSSDTFTGDAATVNTLDVLVSLGGIEFPSVSVATGAFRDLTHGLPSIPFWIVVQSSADQLTWSPVVSGVGGWTVAIDATKIRVTNASGAARFVRAMVIG